VNGNGELATELRAAREALTALSTEMAEQNVKRDERIRTNRRAIRLAFGVAGIALIGALVTLIVAIGAIHSANTANDAAAKANGAVAGLRAERNERITSNCQTSNEQAKQIVDDTFRNDVYLADVLSPKPRTEQEQAFIWLAIATHVRQVKEAHPSRDCSPHALGIAPLLVPPRDSGSTPSTGPAAAPGPTLSGSRPTPGRSSPPTTVRRRPVTTTTVCQHLPNGKCRRHPRGR
jgi:hypothetical protein